MTGLVLRHVSEVGVRHVVDGELTVVESSFEDCQFVGLTGEAKFGSGVQQTVFRGCLFADSDIRSVTPGNVLFEDCRFDAVRISRFISGAAEFVRCSFSGTIEEAVLSAQPSAWEAQAFGRSRNRVTGNDLRECRLSGVGFRRGVDLSDQRFPPPSHCFVLEVAQDLPRLRTELPRLLDASQRREAEIRVEMWEEDAASGQSQVLVQARDWTERGMPEVYALLRQVAQRPGA
ncbi:hypothetical protein [Arthrobacter sp. NEB 688]|uniref:hypothetical protein n=1 Tax=Arthrobacter sp. NEB 688 TaxID=904039 RepID=UPI001567C0C3|nr:hypothetical protein [Arthrobacter sp. NEB 688]QKE85246.1 hypothetical protein HL663_15730 [Arthrobacter sp. NEB 688]